MISAHKYWAIFRIQLQNNITYFGDLFANSIAIVIFLWIFTQLWKVTYASLGETEIAGLTLSDTLWYLMLAETIVLSKPRLSQPISEAVKDGSIAYLLNKPYNFILYQFSIGFSDSIFRIFSNFIAGGILVWLLVGPPSFSINPFLIIPAILLAWIIDFCISTLIGLSAFLTEDISAFEWIYSKLTLILGGVLIPLDFYPAWIRNIAQLLPFANTVYGPAKLFVQPEISRFLYLLLFQLFWAIVLGVIVTIVYRRGVQWLNINGG